MKNIIKVIIAVCLFLVSCNKLITYNLRIDNLTNDTIQIELLFKENKYSFTSLPNTNDSLFETSISYLGIFECDPKIKENEVEIEIFSGKTLKKEIWDANNWICEDAKNGEWILTFIITENDLE